MTWLRNPFSGGGDGTSPSLPRVDPAMRSALARALGSAAELRPADRMLAVLVDESIRRPRTSRGAFARAQHAALIGAWFVEIDALLPGSESPLHAAFDAARLPVLKLSMADRRVFAEAQHPVRQLLDAAMNAATPTALTRASARGLIESQVQSQTERLQDMAARVQPMLEALAPVDDRTADAFLEDVRDRTALRRDETLRHARRVAAQELETQILGRSLQPSTALFLRQGWVPMMATLLLRDGLDSPAVDNGMQLLARMLSVIDGRPPAADEAPLVPAVRDALLDAGQPRAPVQQLLDALQAAIDAAGNRTHRS